ncbi:MULTISPECIES: heme-binding domain-containing protein [unclassified Lentimicrobium]|uniref:heme-binding domain-containing protein n=1 Tax=unclassified Lentimicrobium TaxID=2677434 RepID=UPI001553D2F1|nr:MULTISPECIES: heme-binding domain-containing protein [unclassified Lentimicrobium]NPD44608.1 heme-binding domain-containing protein [Lentimicrobium sp. S6]NPD83320.1 heme-binding domain-containing protein [Lentimicrobium sp. L6]
MKFLRILFILLITAFVVIQFVGIEKTNPEFDSSSDFIVMENPPEDVAQMLRSSCYDCHSNETIWPWYSNIAPVSWMLEEHVEDGRDNINLNFWGEIDLEDRAYVIEEMIEEMEEGEMPIPGYLITHSNAKLSDAQKEKLFAWLRSKQ